MACECVVIHKAAFPNRITAKSEYECDKVSGQIIVRNFYDCPLGIFINDVNGFCC
jgi:hypothetical protein